MTFTETTRENNLIECKLNESECVVSELLLEIRRTLAMIKGTQACL